VKTTLLNVHVSVQDSSLRESKREKRLGNGVFSCSNQGEYSPGPVYLSLPAVCPHASSARCGGGLCVCAFVCAVLGVLRPLEGNRQILLAGLTQENTVNNATR